MTKPITRRAALSRPAPMPLHDGPPVEALRTRAITARAPMSPAVARVVASLAFPTADSWQGRHA